eukprot:11195287-Lingulodinium_polyedra.AAC.1
MSWTRTASGRCARTESRWMIGRTSSRARWRGPSRCSFPAIGILRAVRAVQSPRCPQTSSRTWAFWTRRSARWLTKA